jgi:hypothetical protein
MANYAFSPMFPFGFQAQAMKEQAQMREEMAYQYKIGNFEVSIMNLICPYFVFSNHFDSIY